MKKLLSLSILLFVFGSGFAQKHKDVLLIYGNGFIFSVIEPKLDLSYRRCLPLPTKRLFLPRGE
jgi:hypothetical protein